MNFAKITQEYYSLWLGEGGLLESTPSGVHFIHSSERNRAQYGYSDPFHLYALCRPDKTIISYGNALADRIDALKDASLHDVSAVKNAVESLFSGKVGHSVKYVLNHIPQIKTHSRALTAKDLTHFCAFNGKSCIAEDWFLEYFTNMVSDRLCWGYFLDGELISCTDAPGMPYLADRVQEIGINTLPKHRGRGYASDACIAAAQEILRQGKCPMWSTSISNLASQRLAEKVGFVPFAEVITLTL